MDLEGLNNVLEKARRYCSNRETCRSDLQKKFISWGLESSFVPKVLKALEEEGFLNELRYARAVVNDQYKFNKWGRVKIRYFLKQHGIPGDIISEAMETIDEEDYLRMVKGQITEKDKHGRYTNKWDRKAKLMRFANSRGYEQGIVAGLIGELEE